MAKTSSACRDWTREEIMLALELYCTVPSEDLNTDNEQIVALAKTIGRTENSVMLKIQNLKACDPNYTRDGRAGLNHVSKMDRTVVKLFLSTPEVLLSETKKIKDAMKEHHDKYV